MTVVEVGIPLTNLHELSPSQYLVTGVHAFLRLPACPSETPLSNVFPEIVNFLELSFGSIQT